MFHHFTHDITGIALPAQFTYPFEYTPHRLTVLAAEQVQLELQTSGDWSGLAEEGKMFGVLVVKNPDGETGFLAAYSGNFNGRNDYPYFVPPAYDLLNPDGFFPAEEAALGLRNLEIEKLENSEMYCGVKARLKETEERGNAEIEEFKMQISISKAKRDALRAAGATSEQEAEMIRESQYLKAELKRKKQAVQAAIDEAAKAVAVFEDKINALKQSRAEKSAEVQNRIFKSFVMLNAYGDKADLLEIFKDTPQVIPPGGSGECAAPKLLQYAYLNGYQPIAIGEFWWGKSPKSKIRHHGVFYPSCTAKCKPILGFMLQGLDVESNPMEKVADKEIEPVWEDERLIVINKPEGLQSVPGKAVQESALTLISEKCGRELYPVHRLDMATSGLLIFAKDAEGQKVMFAMFENREVEKHYAAVLEKEIDRDCGTIELPICSDYENRPRQMVSYEDGKEAVTEFKVLKRSAGKTLVDFSPITGRTHQLRVHAAHKDGLDAPILGDGLYGTISAKRLHLHACKLKFKHPFTGQVINIELPIPFDIE